MSYALTFRPLRSLLARHRAASRIRRELKASSDRALAEIGIARGDIASIADGKYRRS